MVGGGVGYPCETSCCPTVRPVLNVYSEAFDYLNEAQSCQYGRDSKVVFDDICVGRKSLLKACRLIHCLLHLTLEWHHGWNIEIWNYTLYGTRAAFKYTKIKPVKVRIRFLKSPEGGKTGKPLLYLIYTCVFKFGWCSLDCVSTWCKCPVSFTS